MPNFNLKNYADTLGPFFPFNCGNQLVASQYALPLKILNQYLPGHSKVLDWGCGSGHFSYLLAHLSYQVDAYAFTPDDLNVIKSKITCVWHHAHAEDPICLPFQDAQFDAVISLGVLEHVRETGGSEKNSLQEIYRILKPGGFFFCFHFPNRYSWIEACARLLKKMKIPKYCHRYLYTKKDIYDLAMVESFTMKEVGLYNLFPRSILRKLPNKIANHESFIIAYHQLERICFTFFSRWAQNYYFVLQK